jgi:hypothetical protein
MQEDTDMTEVTTTRREAADPRGEWAHSRGPLMSDSYLASRPRAIDRSHAENLLEIRPDLRTAAGAVLAAPLAIAMLDAAGINVDPANILALTQVNIEILDCAVDVHEAHLEGRVTTEARSQVFTEARICDAADRARPIGFGTANWSVICPTPKLWQAYTGRRQADGLLEIPELRPQIGAGRLHHGPMLVVTEAAALDAAADVLETDAVSIDSLEMTIVAPGSVGPFVATPVLVATSADTVGCRVELRDRGRNDRLVAATFVRMREYL